MNEHEDSEKLSLCRTIVKGIFYYFLSPFDRIFDIGHLIFVRFPSKLKKKREYRNTPKTIKFYRVSTCPVKVQEANELIGILHDKEVQEESLKKNIKRPIRLIKMLENLIDESESPFPKMPTIAELEMIRSEICEDSHGASIWAYDDQNQKFVEYSTRTGNTSPAHPENVVGSLLSGNAPESRERNYAYAVSVTPKESDTRTEDSAP